MNEWKLAGTYFETCNCTAACPCVFTSPPTEGECTALVAWHIDHGVYGDTSLDGLNVAIAIHAPGTMVQTQWKIAVYFDENADTAQNDALHAIFSGSAGGHPAVLASFVDEIVGAKNVPMHYRDDGNACSLTIPGIMTAEIERLEGQGGRPVTIENHPFCVAPGEPATVARSKRFSFGDFGWDWELSGRNGFQSAFAYQSE